MNRRDFVAALVAVGSRRAMGSTTLGAGAAPRVSAIPTVFFAQPDARTALVRFIVEGATAVAGRLRVFDRAHRQLGTAGVIGVGGRMLGELWLPLDRDTEIISELEMPQVRGVVRTMHGLSPRRRWTVYWMVAKEGSRPAGPEPEFLDHDEFLRVAQGVEPGAMMLDSTGLLERLATSPLVLAGSGVRWVGLRDARAPLARFASRDGSDVVAVAIADVGTAEGLGTNGGRNEMARRLEQWLDGPGSQLADESHAVSLMVGTATEDGTLAERIADWNSRYAYPRIVTGRPEELFGIIERRAPIATGGPGGRDGPGGPDGPGGMGEIERQTGDNAARAARVFEPLVTRLQASSPGLAAIAEQFAFATPSTLVVNPTPFAQTGIAVMPDGSERLVTDVPALGYLCLPHPGRPGAKAPPDAGRWVGVPGSDNDLTLDSRHFEIRIDRETGAIRSLVTRANGRQWVRRTGALNAAAGFRLVTIQKARNGEVGTRVIVTRTSGEGLPLVSSITVYEDLPWVDFSNERASDAGPTRYSFAFALERPTPSWEVPAGFEERPARAEIRRLVHLRWLRLVSGGDIVFFRGLDAPVASLTADGEILSQAPPRQSRYRLGFASGYSAADDPWRFGWGTEPLLTVPVPGTGRARLASYGSLLLVDQSGISVTELRKDRGGDGVVLFLQELTGVPRDITVGPGVLTFRGARRIDFLERDLGALPLLAGGGVSAPIRGYGITAIRLTGVELARG
ncbi:MAG: hypothetical protein HY700_04525 [Gemmatimonadetes bacterium]|nr:hypothetical protein [Gemmatimonadota bacterium]